MVVRQLVLAVLIAVSVVGCSSVETEGESTASPDGVFGPRNGTWVSVTFSSHLVEKVVFSGEGFQTFMYVDDTETFSEGVCVHDDDWTDDAGDFWYLSDCTITVGETGETYRQCFLDHVSADGSVWEWNLSESGCPQGHGPDDPPIARYERAES